MVCAPVRRDNPRALARGLLTVQAHKPCLLSILSARKATFTVLSLVRANTEGVNGVLMSQQTLFQLCRVLSQN